MKTGRLLKFTRGDADIHAYLYREGDAYAASLYVLAASPSSREPTHTLRGENEAALEAAVRAWIEAYYPKAKR